jgi:Tfp pilus assembly protein PilO
VRALFASASEVPLSRVAAEHRRWLLPVGIVLAINVVVLIALVLPLRRSVAAGSTQALSSAATLREAAAELTLAEATRDGQAQAAKDLDRFYGEVLPADFAAARRITHVKLAQMAREHDVMFVRGQTSPEAVRDSNLERLLVSCSLAGEWDDIRQLIYDIETGPDFIVIDNVGLSEGNEPNAPLALELQLSTYYRVPRHDR